MSTRSDLESALLPVVETLERVGATYRIGGSVASSAFGMPRSTLDVDLVTDLGGPHVKAFVAALEPDYYVDESAIRDAIRRRASFNLIHLGTMMKVDVFIAGPAAFDRASFARFVERPLSDAADARSYRLRSAEDVVLRKLEWYRLGGEVSERQWSDAVGVLKVQAGSLDHAYLDEWAGELGVADLLARARSDAARS